MLIVLTMWKNTLPGRNLKCSERLLSGFPNNKVLLCVYLLGITLSHSRKVFCIASYDPQH